MKKILTSIMNTCSIKQTNKQTNKRFIMQKWKEVQVIY